MTRIRIKHITTAAALMSASAIFYVQADTTTFDVTAEVENSCTITANPMAFGAVNVLGGDIDGSTTVAVTCTDSAAYNIGLNQGLNGLDTSSRQMQAADATALNYALFREIGRTSNWGNNPTGVDSDTVADTGSGSEQVHTVYGRISQGQTTVSEGSYSDTITATVYY